MWEVETQITLDASGRYAPPCITVPQGSTGCAIVAAMVRNHRTVDIPAGARIVCRGIRSDGKEFTIECENLNPMMRCVLPADATDCVGYCSAEFYVTFQEKMWSRAGFFLKITESHEL